RRAILQARLLLVEGTLQIEGEVIHVVAKRCSNITGLLRQQAMQAVVAPMPPLSRADERVDEPWHHKDKRVPPPVQPEIFPQGRNFR
ncbi:MAG: hypothetical protein EBZ77_08800, partial [Chitinophagia bacterium]|nr:hypothetical protein [Chitinophagia bacterium]